MVSTFTSASEVSTSPVKNDTHGATEEIASQAVDKATQATAKEIAKETARETAKETAREIARQMSQECVARRLRQVNRTITRLYDEALRPYGLTVNQLNILAVILSERQIQPGQLGQALGMEKSTVSRTIDRMARKNWLQVSAGKDSRTQLLRVTAKGRQLLLSVTPIWDTLQQSVLSSDDGQNILQMLALNTEPVETPQAQMPDIEAPLAADDFYL
ncbi:MarR family winged helix-turn-helix transcriptional regulator [cf. Phormidesmis sp. LEGE 11477]|uniref:MarR family winged helix-turn-helix transcriptional regulator n=1 Tax=cf. Phormidesmis sp. LEGE 11477 TaxID=1828680 RepID=UPI00187DF8FA|nr:MarR family winged helix-turn-helix transcriptional regulator [cf. Phormidesmis sp. LEGE 11477]MBE9063244.1 winged helix-turn-helix transcriptional regulator [cf. Phormidesmis sp. LEGE 11477]